MRRRSYSAYSAASADSFPVGSAASSAAAPKDAASMPALRRSRSVRSRTDGKPGIAATGSKYPRRVDRDLLGEDAVGEERQRPAPVAHEPAMAEPQPELADRHQPHVEMPARQLGQAAAQIRAHQRAAHDDRQRRERIARALRPHLVGEIRLQRAARPG